MKIICKNLSVLLIFSLMANILCISSFAEGGEGNYSGSGSSGGGGGSSVIVSPPYTISAVYKNYIAKGTIFLPDGVVAPAGGIEVYSAFGGITLENPTAYSIEGMEIFEENLPAGNSGGAHPPATPRPTTRPGGSIVVPKAESIPYEKYNMAAIIPAGENSVEYECSFQLPATHRAFYGKFWVYDNKGCEISSQMVISNLALVRTGVIEYEHIDVSLTAPTGMIGGTVSLPAESALGDNLDVFVVAQNQYDTFISKAVLIAGEYTAAFSMGLERNDGYELFYYIPSSVNPHLQTIRSGIYAQEGMFFLEYTLTTNFELTLQPVISGTIRLPSNHAAPPGGIALVLTTEDVDVNLLIPPGENSCDYQIGVLENTDTFLKCEVVNSRAYGGGYYTYEGVLTDFPDWICVENENIYDIDFELPRMFTVYGTISLPSSVTMAEDTYFTFGVYAKNADNGSVYSTMATIYSDVGQAEYFIVIPIEETAGEWILYYNFWDVVSMPSVPLNPIPLSRSPGGGYPGGGGGSSNIGYTYERPAGLLYKYDCYFTPAGISAHDKNREIYRFDGESLHQDRTLLGEAEEEVKNIIGGYFSSAIALPKNGLDVTASLIDMDGNSRESLNFHYTGGNVPYIFKTDLTGDFKIQYEINGEVYYFKNNYLTTDIAAATMISTEDTPVQYQKDVYYKNCFSVYAGAQCVNNWEHAIKIYDINGNLLQEVSSQERFWVLVTPFVMGIGNLYFSEFDRFRFSGLTARFEEAVLANASYRDYLTEARGNFEIDTTYREEERSNWLEESNYTEPVLNGSTFEITTPGELAWVSYKVMTGSTFVNKTVMLKNDIDLSAHEWTPIGGFNGTRTDTSKVFRGTFDGQGYEITGLKIGSFFSRSQYEYCGLFGYIYNATINHVSLTEVAVYNSGKYTGGLIGVSGDSTIGNIQLDGTIVGDRDVGGVVSNMSARLLNSVSFATVSGGSYTSPLVGYGNGEIENCASLGNILSNSYGGGIAGYFHSSIKNCYSSCQFSGGMSGAVAYYAPNTQNCYYNSDLCAKGLYYSYSTDDTVAKTTAQMQSEEFTALLNRNANPAWNDWIVGGNAFPALSDSASRFWKACDYDLEETENTYYVSTPQELAWIADKVNHGENFRQKTVVLCNDIDLNGRYWIPIGTDTYSFSGTFDGKEYSIFNMKIGDETYTSYYNGLFGHLTGGEILNTRLKNVKVFGGIYTGALAGRIDDRAFVENCVAQGEVMGMTSVGGLIGHSDNNSNIHSSYSLTKVTGNNNVGGLLGYVFYGAISNCYSISEVIGTENNIGGLIGYSYNGTISNCYAQSSVSGRSYAGGLVGYVDAYNNTMISGCYWNIDMPQSEDGFALSNSGKKAFGYGNCTAAALTGEEMKSKDNFIGWDFSKIWLETKSYPILKWQNDGTLVGSYLFSDVSLVDNYVALNVTKTFDKEQEDTIVYAAYDSYGALLDMIIDNLSMDNGSKPVTSVRSFNFPENKTPDKVKVFIWNSLAGMKPLSDIETICFPS